MAAELEKYMGSPYTINVVEEIARNKMMTMVHDKREEDRKRLFEETAQVSSVPAWLTFGCRICVCASLRVADVVVWW